MLKKRGGSDMVSLAAASSARWRGRAAASALQKAASAKAYDGGGINKRKSICCWRETSATAYRLLA